jgi:hypothetical protein
VADIKLFQTSVDPPVELEAESAALEKALQHLIELAFRTSR